MLDQWVRETDRPWRETDAAACREAIVHRAELGLFGLIMRNGPDSAAAAVGLIIAAALPDGSASILFAKALRSAPGAFPFMISAFAQQHHGRFARLNFEQDLGRPGFRQAKRAYGPLRLLHKYRVFRHQS